MGKVSFSLSASTKTESSLSPTSASSSAPGNRLDVIRENKPNWSGKSDGESAVTTTYPPMGCSDLIITSRLSSGSCGGGALGSQHSLVSVYERPSNQQEYSQALCSTQYGSSRHRLSTASYALGQVIPRRAMFSVGSSVHTVHSRRCGASLHSCHRRRRRRANFVGVYDHETTSSSNQTKRRR